MDDRQKKVHQLMDYGKAILSTKITSLTPRFPHYHVLTFHNAHWAALFLCEKDYYVDIRYGEEGAKHRYEVPFCKPYYMHSGEWVGLDLSQDINVLKKAMKACFDRHNDADDILVLDDDFREQSSAVAIPPRAQVRSHQSYSSFHNQNGFNQKPDKQTPNPQRKPAKSKKESIEETIKGILAINTNRYNVAEVNYAQGLMLSTLKDHYKIVPLQKNAKAYQDLTVEQLRSYLTLREGFKKHQYPSIPGPYDLIYAQEIINDINVSSYEDGLQALEELEQAYHQPVLKEWIEDYEMIYELDDLKESVTDFKNLQVKQSVTREAFINSLKFFHLMEGHCDYAKDQKAYEELLYFVFEKLERQGFFKRFIMEKSSDERPLFRGSLYYHEALPLFFFDRTIGDTRYIFNIHTQMLTINKQTFKDLNAMHVFMQTLDRIIDHFFKGTPLNVIDLHNIYEKCAYDIVGVYQTMEIFYDRRTKRYESHIRLNMLKKKSFVEMGQYLAHFELPYHYLFYADGNTSCFYEDFTCEKLCDYLYLRTCYKDGDDELLQSQFQQNYLREVMCGIGFQSLEEAFSELKKINDLFEHDFDFELRFFLVVHHMEKDHPEYFKEEQRHESLLVLTDPQASDEEYFQALMNVSHYDLTKNQFYKDHKERMMHIVHEVMKSLINQKELSILDDYFYIINEHVLFGDLHLEDFHIKKDEKVYFSPIHYFYEDSQNSNIHESYVSLMKESRAFVKEIDCAIREVYHSGRAIKHSLKHQKIIKAIKATVIDEKEAYEQEEREKRKVKINYTSLSKIREDADYITDQVATSEEKAIMEDHQANLQEKQEESTSQESLLSDDEKEILHCLVHHQSIDDYINDKHLLASVVIDELNEKFFDELGDSIIDFDGEHYRFVDDYLEDVEKYLDHDENDNQEKETNTLGLTKDEREILNLYMKHQSTKDYIAEHHLLESVIVDNINEKFFDELGDSIIDFDGEYYRFVDDYLDDVKEILGL